MTTRAMPPWRRAWLWGVLLVIYMAVSACSCGNLLAKRQGQRPSPTPKVAAKGAEVTLAPSITPKATLPVPTKAPSAAPGSGLAAIPKEPNKDFTVVWSEQEINEYLADQVFTDQGVSVRDARLTLTPDLAIAQFTATQKDTGLTIGLTVQGTFVVADGKAYLRVENVSLDPSVTGFTRTIAKSLIEQILQQMSQPQGIPIPVDNIIFQEIRLGQGQITIVGRTR
jgi:hypothetical protein